MEIVTLLMDFNIGSLILLVIFILDYLNILKMFRHKLEKLSKKYEQISYEGKLNMPINDQNRIIPI